MKILKFKIRLLISWLLLYSEMGSCSDYHVWKPLIVSANHINNVTDISWAFPAADDMVCAMTASRNILIKTIWFKDQVCGVSSYMAEHERMAVGATIPNPVNAMVKIYGTCDPPFILAAPYGCFSRTPRETFNQTRKYCQSLGGDLWTFEQNATKEYVAAVRTATQTLNYASYFGMYGQGKNWVWLNGDVVNLTNFYIYTWPPNGTIDGQCFVLNYEYTMFGNACTRTSTATCQKMAIL